MPPGWTANPSTPYSIGNHTQFSNAGFGPGTSFIINVPVSERAQVGQSGGDGTLPIPVGNRVYGVQHHLNAGAATIMCWDLSSLAICPPSLGGPSSWPRSIGSDLMTPTLVRHAVVGTKIYFPSARVVGSGATATTTPGIGCWDTLTETPCPFLPLPGGPSWVGNPPWVTPRVSTHCSPGLQRIQRRLGDCSSMRSTPRPLPRPVRSTVSLFRAAACTGWISPIIAHCGWEPVLST